MIGRGSIAWQNTHTIDFVGARLNVRYTLSGMHSVIVFENADNFFMVDVKPPRVAADVGCARDVRVLKV